MKILDNAVEPIKEEEVPEFPCYYRAHAGSSNRGLVVLFFEEQCGLIVEPSKGWSENKVGVFRSNWGSCYNGNWERMPKGYGKLFIQE